MRMLNLKNIAKSVNLPKVNMNTAFNPSKLNSLYSRAMPSSYYDDAFNYASKVGFNIESPEFQKYLVDNINFKPQQWNSEINEYERVFKSPENVIDGLANRFNLNKSTIPLYRVDRNESMLSTDSFDALKRIKENTNLPHSKYMTLGTGDLDWYAKHPSWNIGKHSLSDSPNSQVMKLDLPKKDFSKYVAGSFMDPILETVQMSKPPGVGQKNKEFIIPTEMLARKGEDLGTYQDFLKLVEGDNALPLLDRMYTYKNHLGRWNSDNLTKSRYDRNNLENQIWAAHNLHLDQNLHEKFLTWPQNEKRFGEQYRSGQWGYKDGGSLPKYQPGGGNSAKVSKAEMDNFKKDGGEQLPKAQFGLGRLVKPALLHVQRPLKKMLEKNTLYRAGRAGGAGLYDNLFNKGLEKSAMPHLLRGEQFVDNWYADPEVASYTESLYRKQYTDPSPFTQFNNWGEYSNFINSNAGHNSPELLRPFLQNQPGYLSTAKGALSYFRERHPGHEGMFSLLGQIGEQADNPGKSYINPRIANSELWFNSNINPDDIGGVRMNDGWEGKYPINITRDGFQRDPQGLFDLAAHEKSHWYVRGAALVPKVTNRWEKFVTDDAFKVIKESSETGEFPEGYNDMGDVYYQTPVEVQARVTEIRGLLSDMGLNNAQILSLQTFGLGSIDTTKAQKIIDEIAESRAGGSLLEMVVKDGYLGFGPGKEHRDLYEKRTGTPYEIGPSQRKAFDNLFNLMRYTPVVAAPIIGAGMLQEEELSEQKIGGEIKKHTIVRGDTGKTLFEKYGVNSSDIKEHNDIKFFKEGQEIEIPSKELSKAQDGRETPSFRNLHDESGNLKLSGEELEAWRSPRGYTYKQLVDYNKNIARYTPQGGIDLQDKTTWEGKHYGSPFNSSNYDLEGFANSDWNPQSYDDAYGMNRDIENASFFYRGQPYSTESKEDNILNWKDEKTLEGIINAINNTSISGMIEDENLQSPEDYYGYLVNQYKDDTDKSRLLKDIKTDFPDDYLSFFSGSSNADRINTLRSDQTTGKPISDYRSSYSTAQGAEGTDEGGYTTAIDNTAYTIPAMEMNPEAAAAQAQNNELREAKLNSYLTNDEYFNQGEGSYTEFSNEYDLEQTNEFKKGYARQYIPEDQIEAFINYTPGSSDEQNPLFDEVYKGYDNQKFVHNVGNINAGQGETSTGTFGLGAYDYNLDEFAEGEIPYYLKDRRASLLSNTDRLEPENYNRYENRDKTFWEDSVGDWWNTLGGKSQNAGLAPSLLHGIADWGGQMIGGAANSISGGNIPSWQWKTGERFRENPNFNTGANAGLDIASVTPFGRLAKMAQSAKFLGTGMKLNKGLKGNLNLLRGNAKDLGVYERMMRFDKANPGVLYSNVGPKGFNIPSNVPGRNYNLNQGMFRNPYANQIGNSGANWNMLTPKGYVNPKYLVPSYLGEGALDMNTNPNVTITNRNQNFQGGGQQSMMPPASPAPTTASSKTWLNLVDQIGNGETINNEEYMSVVNIL